MRALAAIWLAFSLLILASCGGTPHPVDPSGPLTGNWQINLLQEYPGKTTSLLVSGFLMQSNNVLSGSVQGPLISSANGSQVNCGGTAQVSGTINGQSVAFTENLGGTTYSFTGTISTDNQRMSGDFNAPGGACFSTPTSGAWNAFLIPPLSGSFTGTLDSNYMQALTGSGNPVPVAVSGSFAQSPNADGSTATVSGTITAVGYPCFTTALLTGTISGQNVYLSLYGYNGLQIGTLGQILQAGNAPTPAILSVTSTTLVMTGSNSTQGFYLDVGTPCPAVINSFGKAQTTDSGGFTLTVK